MVTTPTIITELGKWPAVCTTWSNPDEESRDGYRTRDLNPTNIVYLLTSSQSDRNH